MSKKVSATARRLVRVDVNPIVMRSDGTIAPDEFTEEELEFFQGGSPQPRSPARISRSQFGSGT